MTRLNTNPPKSAPCHTLPISAGAIDFRFISASERINFLLSSRWTIDIFPYLSSPQGDMIDSKYDRRNVRNSYNRNSFTISRTPVDSTYTFTKPSDDYLDVRSSKNSSPISRIGNLIHSNSTSNLGSLRDQMASHNNGEITQGDHLNRIKVVRKARNNVPPPARNGPTLRSSLKNGNGNSENCLWVIVLIESRLATVKNGNGTRWWNVSNDRKVFEGFTKWLPLVDGCVRLLSSHRRRSAML